MATENAEVKEKAEITNNIEEEKKGNDIEMIDLDSSLEDNEPKTVNNINDFTYDESLCSLCNLAKFDIECGLSKAELNHLLGFILSRIKSWVRGSCKQRLGCIRNVAFSSLKILLVVWLLTQLRNGCLILRKVGALCSCFISIWTC